MRNAWAAHAVFTLRKHHYFTRAKQRVSCQGLTVTSREKRVSIVRMWRKIGSAKRKRQQYGAALCLLQRQLVRFSDARLDRAMQAAWRKEYDPQEFFSVALPQNGDAIIHAFGAEIEVKHLEYAIGAGDEPLPFWAKHTGHTMLLYRCGQDPDDAARPRMYRGLAMLAADLASVETAGFYFPHEQVLLPNSLQVNQAFRGKGALNPFALESLADE